MPRDILHVLGTAREEGTGIARIVAALAAGLDRRRYRVHAWFYDGDGPLVAMLEQAGAIVRVLDWRGGARDPIGAWRFWRAYAAGEFALVHQHAGGRSMRRLVRLCSRARIVVHRHGTVAEPDLSARGPVAIHDADAIVAASRSVARQIAPPPEVTVIYAGTAQRRPEAASPIAPRRGRVVGTACRLVPAKGLHHLLDAVALLCAGMPDLRLEIAGTGPEEEALRARARQLGIADRVGFLGWRMDLAPVLAGWDVFCVPSLAEGFGLAALEAMAAGLPVVATSVGGLTELVADGLTGYLVPASDSRALAAGLESLLRDRSLRERMGEAAHARATAHFAADRMVREIGSLYDSLLRTRHEPGG